MNTLTVFSELVILKIMVQFFSIADLVRLSRTCKTLYDIIQKEVYLWIDHMPQIIRCRMYVSTSYDYTDEFLPDYRSSMIGKTLNQMKTYCINSDILELITFSNGSVDTYLPYSLYSPLAAIGSYCGAIGYSLNKIFYISKINIFRLLKYEKLVNFYRKNYPYFSYKLHTFLEKLDHLAKKDEYLKRTYIYGFDRKMISSVEVRCDNLSYLIRSDDRAHVTLYRTKNDQVELYTKITYAIATNILVDFFKGHLESADEYENMEFVSHLFDYMNGI